MFNAPIIEEHQGTIVVRDDLIPGGTKSRFLVPLFEAHQEIVYASPAYGGAQLSLAYSAQMTGKAATVFVAKRKELHARTQEARLAGARIHQVSPGYLTNVQAKAKRYANDTGAFYMQFGGGTEAINILADAASQVAQQVGPLDEVWCAAGSGVLLRALQQGLPAKRYIGVEVGHHLSSTEIGQALLMTNPLPFEREYKGPVPFPSCRNYDAKAWAVCRDHGQGRRLFWNVLGPSPTWSMMGLEPKAVTG
jgi:hypothetical protein